MSTGFTHIVYNNCQTGDIKEILKNVPDDFKFFILTKECFSQNIFVDIDYTLKIVTVGEKTN